MAVPALCEESLCPPGYLRTPTGSAHLWLAWPKATIILLSPEPQTRKHQVILVGFPCLSSCIESGGELWRNLVAEGRVPDCRGHCAGSPAASWCPHRYYKKFSIPDLDRHQLPLDDSALSFAHAQLHPDNLCKICPDLTSGRGPPPHFPAPDTPNPRCACQRAGGSCSSEGWGLTPNSAMGRWCKAQDLGCHPGLLLPATGPQQGS